MGIFETIRNWFVNGDTVRINVSNEQVNDDMIEFAWDLATGEFTESTESKVIRLRNEGFNQKQIAQQVNLTQNQVKGILFKLLSSGKVDRKNSLSYNTFNI